MDLETSVKIIGGIIAAIGGLLAIGEKLFKWGGFTYQSLKKIHSGTREKLARAEQPSFKKLNHSLARARQSHIPNRMDGYAYQMAMAAHELVHSHLLFKKS